MTTLLGRECPPPTLNALNIIRQWCDLADADTDAGLDSYRGELFFARVTGAFVALRLIALIGAPPSHQATKAFLLRTHEIFVEVYGAEGEEWEKAYRSILEAQGLPQ